MTNRSARSDLTRRQLLRHGGRAVAALPFLGLLPALVRYPLVSAATPGQTRAGEWAADDALSVAADGQWGEFAAPFAFQALGAHWAAGAGVAIEISVSGDGAAWSPWQAMHPDAHGAGPSRADREFGELQHLAPSRYVRYRAGGSQGEPLPAPADLRFVYIDASDGPTAADLPQQLGAFGATLPAVVPRAAWGCDEKLRFDKAGKEVWSPEHYIAEKIIIHHTQTPNEQDPLQAIRSVYHYHAVTKEFGDIGYNFLVDRNGVIYEGRFGGEHVVGGHALSYNYGSVGIALIGSFATAPDSPAAEAAITQLAAYKGRFLDPQGRYYFVDKMIPNIAGHRDVLSTACPGDALYPRLANIRQGVAAILGAAPKMDVAIGGIGGKGGTVVVQTPYTVTVTVKNTGTSVLPSYYDKGLTYLEGDTFDSKGQRKVEGRFRIVADVESTPAPGVSPAPAPGTPPATPIANPYRWGFGRSLNPGETVEVACRLAFSTAGMKRLRFGLVQENIGYKQQGLDGPALRVIGNPADPLPQPVENTADLTYFPETRHTLRGVLRRYWEKFGGLAQFGYPLTEEFVELNEADGKEYTVQYFERARFEHHPENAGTDYEVLLGLVGPLFHPVDKPAAPSNDPTHTYFPQTGHNLGGSFKTYWEQYGGLFVYGYPITEEIAERSRIDGQAYTVQYFERARFEFHPENTGKSRVLLGHLGRQMLQDRGWIK